MMRTRQRQRSGVIEIDLSGSTSFLPFLVLNGDTGSLKIHHCAVKRADVGIAAGLEGCQRCLRCLRLLVGVRSKLDLWESAPKIRHTQQDYGSLTCIQNIFTILPFSKC